MEKKKFPKAKKPFPRKSTPKYSKEKEEIKTKADNDASWYTGDGQLLKDVSSFSFNSALGADITIKGYTKTGSAIYHTRVPGIFSIMTVPTIGISDSASAPVNVAARKIYSYVRHANSGHSNYDPADLMMYLLSMDSLYTYWSHLTRIYGITQVFSKTNRYVGDALLRAMGVDPYSIRSNLADLRAYINMFAVKASSFAVPKTMSYFIRHSWMYSNIYKDEDTAKAQMYMYVPAFLYKYAIDSSTGAGMLEATPVSVTMNASNVIIGETTNTFTQLYMLGDILLNAVMAQEDLGIISGDILKAYGPENLWKLDPVPEGYAVLPTFSEEMLGQIHNTDFASYRILYESAPGTLTFSPKGLDVKQDTSVGNGNLMFQPMFGNATHLWHDRILDFWNENPSPEQVMVGTRNKLVAVPVALDPTQRGAQITGCGSEIALCAFLWKYDNNNALGSTQVFYGDNGYQLAPYGDLSKFNEYPIYYATTISGDSAGEINGILGEMDTYTVLSSWEVEQLHLAALLSMFGVPYLK